MFTWRCPTCLAVLRDEIAPRCPVCHENLVRKMPVIVGGERMREWWRRTPWERRTKEQIDAHFATRPLPGRR